MDERKEEPKPNDSQPGRERHNQQTLAAGEAQQRERKQLYVPQEGPSPFRLLHPSATFHKTLSSRHGQSVLYSSIECHLHVKTSIV